MEINQSQSLKQDLSIWTMLYSFPSTEMFSGMLTIPELSLDTDIKIALFPSSKNTLNPSIVTT